jgi:hypothetical protein
VKKTLLVCIAAFAAAAFAFPASASSPPPARDQVVAFTHAGAAAADAGITNAADLKETMTLKISIAHASAGYSAIAHVAKGSYGAQEAKDGHPPIERWIHSSASAVVHELQPGETVDQAENRALQRMWGAYSAAGGGKTYDGKPLPTWDELGADRQACWRAALQAI